ncbi:MAG TPA: DUF89 family protein [Desulfonatronum sp.]|nr:DUF89 family protein [Desulfonatronum sp.]
METTHDCLPCFIRQALEAVRFATSDQDVHESVLRRVLTAAADMDLKQSPPLMGQVIHRLVRQISGNDDPYKSVKAASNRFALKMYPLLKEKIEKSAAPVETAVRFAIAGNIIDFGVNNEISPEIIEATIERSLTDSLCGSRNVLQQFVFPGKKILYLGDNAGEIVFDRMLIEKLSADRIFYAVRGGPVINDATLADAEETGMTGLVDVVDNGSDAPGTVLSECSADFLRLFEDADFVIAKGQGNFETLSHVNKPIVFLLKAKCPVIARHIGCDIGTAVIWQRFFPTD